MNETATNETEIAEELRAMPGNLTRHWGWLVALGVLSTLLGVMGLWMSIWLTVASVLVFGLLLAVGGGLQLFDATKCKGWKSTFAHGGIALIYLIAGVLMIFDPLSAAIALTLVLGVALLTAGSLRLVIAFQHRKEKGWTWAAFGGALSLLLGVLVLVQWPVSGVWVIGLVVAIELLINGWTAIFLGLAARRVNRTA
ncbi:HdeD family acid-resistance protein [Imhoffiella purpurea]|uniref:HdeD protein n=1 Tax=Imhoffiella purpurea TaxID=1249627 RepID=W9V4I5_9GAMM|nr:DUF308 domain-containing protein [Imhoffiella purpurea]EXJ14259.1 hypothetical protein D779_2930 [Imhoffiella purpurea]